MATPEPTPAPTPGGALVETEWCPIYKWGQLKRKVVLTIFVPCLDEGNVKTTVRANGLTFRAERVAAFAGGKESQRIYSLNLELEHEIDEDTSKAYLRHDHVRVELVKKQEETWETLQPPHVPKNPNERPDFDLIGEDEKEDEKLCRERPRGNGRERSEREIYLDWRRGARQWRMRKMKSLRFAMRDLDQRRQNARLTGGVVYALFASVLMVGFALVRLFFGSWSLKFCVLLTVLFAVIRQWGLRVWLYLYRDLPKPIRDNIAQTFQTSKFVDD